MLSWEKAFGEPRGTAGMVLAAPSTADRAGDVSAFATTLGGFGDVLVDLRDFDRARPLLDRAVALLRQKGAPPSMEQTLGTALRNLARWHQEQGQLSQARPLLEEVLTIRSRGPAPGRALAQLNLGSNLQEQGDLDGAEALYSQAASVFEAAKATSTPDFATSLLNRAMIRLLRRDLPAAQPLYERGIAIREQVLGPDHRDTGDALERFAVFQYAAGRPLEALATMERATGIAEHHLAIMMNEGSEAQKLAYMRAVQENTDIIFSMRSRAEDHQGFNRLAAASLVERKGRALDAVIDLTAVLRRHLSPDNQASFDQLRAARTRLGGLLLNRTPVAPADRSKRTAELVAEIDRLGGELAARSDEARATLRRSNPEEIQTALGATEALVDYVRYLPFDPTAIGRANRFGTARYAVMVLRPGTTARWHELGDAAAIDAAAEAWRAALRSPRDSTVGAKGRALFELIWKPLVGELTNVDHAYVVPDDVLNLVPFAALQAPDGRYLLQSLDVSYLASSRDLLRTPSPDPSREPALVVAAPAFGRRIAGRSYFAPLAGTAKEAQAIGPLLRGARVVTGAAATEAAVKAAKGPAVLHLATHAIFVGQTTRRTPSGTRGLTLTNRVAEDPVPLARAAIVLAGANAPPTGSEDGLLTALEAADLDLRGTRMVVMSACETGLGEVRAGDGVYGFRRTLAIAGAETQVLTLWQIPDEPTARLTTAFYRRLPAGRSAALRQAQLELLASAPNRHPYYWAGFVLAGHTGRMPDR